MKVKYLKLKNWLLVTVMSALGFSSCHCHKQLTNTETAPDPKPEVEDRGEMRLMYGVPTMDFQIRGQVKDAQGKPVKNIRINMLERNMEIQGAELQGDPDAVERWLESSSVITDKKGYFELKNRGIPQEQVRLLVRDVDGKKNGEFKDRMVEMEVTADDVDRTQAGGWNQGTYSKEVEIKLEEK